MSGLLLPKHMRGEQTAENIKKTGVNNLSSDDFLSPTDVQMQLAQLHQYVEDRRQVQSEYHLPRPSGWKLLVLVLTIPETSAGGVYIVDDSREQRALSSPQGVILDLGPAAYTDPDRFTVGDTIMPWHEVGDRILCVKYDMSMFQLANGQRLGLLNDTQPVATIDKGWEVPK